MYVCRRSTFSVSFCILFECKVNVLTYIVIDSNIHFIATLIVKNTNIVYYLTTLTIMFSKPTAVSQAWLAHPTRPNFRDKEVKFHGENWQFPAFMQALRHLFQEKQLGVLLLREADRPVLPAPVVPRKGRVLIPRHPGTPTRNSNPSSPVVQAPSSSSSNRRNSRFRDRSPERPGGGGDDALFQSSSSNEPQQDPDADQYEYEEVPLTADELKYNLEVEYQRVKMSTKYEQGMSIIHGKLGPQPASLVGRFMRNQDSAFKNFEATMQALKERYECDSDVTYAELYNLVDSCPMVNTFAEAELFISLVESTDMDMFDIAPERALSDFQKRAFVLQKFGPTFNHILDCMQGTFQDTAPWSFFKIAKAVVNMKDMERMRNAKGRLTSAASSSTSSELDVSAGAGAAPSLISAAAGSSPSATGKQGCKNCGKTDHFVRNCDSMCKLCANPSSPHPHHPMDCPEFLRSKASRSQDRKPSRTRGPPHENLYNKVKQARPNRVNEVRTSEFYADFDQGGDYHEEEEEDMYLPDEPSNHMVYAPRLPRWPEGYMPACVVVHRMFLLRAWKRSARGGALPLPPLYLWYSAVLLKPVTYLKILGPVITAKVRTAAELSAGCCAPSNFHMRPNGYEKVIGGNNLAKVTVTFFLRAALRWERYCQPRVAKLSLTSAVWLDPAGWEAVVHSTLRARKMARKRPRFVVPPGLGQSSSVLAAAGGAGPRRCSRFVPLHHRDRPYLQACKYFKSSVRGRGRGYITPWWSLSTPVLSSVNPDISQDEVVVSSVFVDAEGRFYAPTVYQLPDLPHDVCLSVSNDAVTALVHQVSASDGVADRSAKNVPSADSDGRSSMPSSSSSLLTRVLSQLIGSDLVSVDVSEAFLPLYPMCFTLSTHPSPQNLSCGMLDTGANLSISHPSLATLLGLEPLEWPSPVPIRFGNSSDAVSTHYVDLGRFLGYVALVESATSTIITKRALHRQGISILFRSDNVCRLILEATDTVLYESRLARSDDFFMIPLQALLPPSMADWLDGQLSSSPSSLRSDAAGSSSAGAPAVVPSEVNGRRALPTVTAAEIAEVMELHERMYHPSSAVMARALRSGAWPGIETSPTLVERVFSHRDCLFCALGKMKRIPRPHGSSITPIFGHEISVDYLPVKTVAKGGFTGAYIFVERAAGYAWAYLLKKPSNSLWLHKAICYVRTTLNRYQHQLCTVRTDAGSVEASEQLATQLAELGIVLNAATPASQYQNFVERFIQTAIHGIATTLLAQSHLDNSFWGLALHAWILAWNCRLNSSSVLGTPMFSMTGRHPDVSVLFKHAFGAAVSSRTLPNPHRRQSFKFDPSGELGFVVGSTGSANGASLVYFPGKSTHMGFPRVDLQPLKLASVPLTRLEVSRHLDNLSVDAQGVTLPEVTRSVVPVPHSDPVSMNVTPSTEDDTSAIPLEDIIHAGSASELLEKVSGDSEGVVEPDRSLGSSSPALLESSSPAVEEEVVTAPQAGPLTPISSPLSSPSVVVLPDDSPEVDESCESDGIMSTAEDEVLDDFSGPPAAGTRSKRVILQVDGQIEDGPGADRSEDMPTCARALRSERAPQWREAIQIELRALMDHNTGTEIARGDVPAGAQLLPAKVVLKIKRDAEGKPTKYKARLVALGNLQNNIPVNVFSPTANDKSLKLLLAISTALRLTILSLDVYGAFLYPDQTGEDVFVVIPPIITGDTSVIWKLNKTMYGLAASPRAFYDHVSAHLLQCGYTRCAADPCFFWIRGSSGFLFAVVHVDDFVVAASTQDLLDVFIAHMEEAYVVSVTPDVKHFLGLYTHDYPCGARVMSQPGLLQKLFDKHPHIGNLTTLPQVPMSSLFNDVAQDESMACDHTAYMELLGSLLYIVKTRPDIAFAVNRMAMRAKKATVKDMNALFRILAYLYATRARGVTLRPMDTRSLRLAAWCDASYALHEDGRSHSGYAFTFMGSPSGMFYARSSKQTNVTLSSTEAELYAAVEAIKDIMWFRSLMAEIGFPQTEPTPMYVDNASMIALATAYSGNHKRVKHFLVRLNFLIDAVAAGVVIMEKVDTLVNLADALTKSLGPTEFIPKADGLLGVPPTSTP